MHGNAWAVAAMLFAFSAGARADYLEVRRSAHLKSEPARDGATLADLAPGAVVELVSDTEQSGYYSVRDHDGHTGFVYRTLVRRHRGAMPSVTAPTGAAGHPTSPVDSPPAPSSPAIDSNDVLSDGPGGPPIMRTHFIDVEQGAATLFEFSCGAVLVDTGGETNGEFNSGDALSTYLDEFFDGRPDLNRTIDLLVITHPHIDHARNIKRVVEEFAVRNVVTDGMTTSSGGRQQRWLQDWAKKNAHLETVEVDAVPPGGKTDGVIDPLACADQDPQIRVLWGAVADRPTTWNAKAFGNANNHSVAVRIDFGSASFLITGDLEEAGLGSLLAKHQNTSALDVDVWQVGHHGSRNGTTGPFLDVVSPEIAVAATGDPSRRAQWTAWQYGHPNEEAINLLLEHVTRRRATMDVEVGHSSRSFSSLHLTRAIYATGWDGTIVVKAQSDGKYAVTTER